MTVSPRGGIKVKYLNRITSSRTMAAFESNRERERHLRRLISILCMYDIKKNSWEEESVATVVFIKWRNKRNWNLLKYSLHFGI